MPEGENVTILPTGECFSDSAEYVEMLVKDDPFILLDDFRIVHAVCKVDDQPELGWFAHCWCERGDSVITGGILGGDHPSAGEKVWLTMSKESFYKELHIQHIMPYSIKDVAYWNKKTGHLGPWEEPYTSFTRQAIQKQQGKEG